MVAPTLERGSEEAVFKERIGIVTQLGLDALARVLSWAVRPTHWWIVVYS